MEWSLLSAVFVLLASVSADIPTRRQLEQARHNKHLQYISGFSCPSRPQPRAIHLRDVLDPSITHGKVYFPDMTVLHRCDGCGSCESGQECKPTHAENLQLQFKVTYTEDIGDHPKNSWDWEYLDFKNHTECSCQPLGKSSVQYSYAARPISSGTRHQEDLDTFFGHVNDISGFSCPSHPQPRVIRLRDVLDPSITQGKSYNPDVIVIHSCDGCGSCAKSMHDCKPTHNETLNLPFKVTYMEDIGYHERGSWAWEYLDFANHTACSCQPLGKSSVDAARPISSGTRYQEELNAISAHANYISSFPCPSHPQPRLIRLTDVLDPSITQGKSYNPDVTVLHRCENCGSCAKSMHVCAPATKDHLHIQFKVTYTEDSDHHVKYSWDWEYLDFYNHTTCTCKPLGKKPAPRPGSARPSYPGTARPIPSYRTPSDYFIVDE